MPALKEIARKAAGEIREGICWVVIYRVGRSWYSTTLHSDLWNNRWETDDVNEALEILRLDPGAVALNGYYLGRFGNMTLRDIAAGIRWYYERGAIALAGYDTLMQARAGIEEARQQAAEAGLPFSERLVDGPEDEFDPYLYDGSMTLEDHNAMQEAGDAAASCVRMRSSLDSPGCPGASGMAGLPGDRRAQPDENSSGGVYQVHGGGPVPRCP